MDRDASTRDIERIVSFCLEQRSAFEPEAWLARRGEDWLVPGALLLANTTWYGHREELLEIVRALDPDALRAPASRVAGFDYLKFMGMVENEKSLAGTCRSSGRHPGSD